MDGNSVVVDPRFERLQEYLADGWDIDPPIFVRPVWHTLHKSEDAYHFVLRREDALHLLVVPSTPDVDLFVSERRLPLNHL